MFTLALARVPPTATKEIQYLNAKGALTCAALAECPGARKFRPNVTYNCFYDIALQTCPFLPNSSPAICQAFTFVLPCSWPLPTLLVIWYVARNALCTR